MAIFLFFLLLISTNDRFEFNQMLIKVKINLNHS